MGIAANASAQSGGSLLELVQEIRLDLRVAQRLGDGRGQDLEGSRERAGLAHARRDLVFALKGRETNEPTRGRAALPGQDLEHLLEAHHGARRYLRRAPRSRLRVQGSVGSARWFGLPAGAGQLIPAYVNGSPSYVYDNGIWYTR